MEVLVLVPYDLRHWPQKLRLLEAGIKHSIIPDYIPITIAAETVCADGAVGIDDRQIEFVARAPPHAGVGQIEVLGHASVHIGVLNHTGRARLIPTSARVMHRPVV